MAKSEKAADIKQTESSQLKQRVATVAGIATIVSAAVAALTYFHPLKSPTSRLEDVSISHPSGIAVGVNSGTLNIGRTEALGDPQNPCVRVTAFGYDCSADGLIKAISGQNLQAIKLIVDGGVGLDAESPWETVEYSLRLASRAVQIATLSEMKAHGLSLQASAACVFNPPFSHGILISTQTRTGCALVRRNQLYCAFKAIGFDDEVFVNRLSQLRRQAEQQASIAYNHMKNTQEQCANMMTDTGYESSDVATIKSACRIAGHCGSSAKYECENSIRNLLNPSESSLQAFTQTRVLPESWPDASCP